ncbi:MAG: hypothetical protein FJZ98_08220 [Chloroflexi bacterium]|nr:hypothetical protein [Chloroflexota bacterium]
MSDEIICSNCGRPNLPEAEKCWYCQTLLKEFMEGDHGDEDTISIGEFENEPHLLGGSEPERTVEDIPEWLKRVRELKKADQPEEEDEDRWQQQILFDSQGIEKTIAKTSEAAKLRPPNKPSREKPQISPKQEDQPLLTHKSKDPEPEPPQIDSEDQICDLKDENETKLPDGFTPLDTKNG